MKDFVVLVDQKDNAIGTMEKLEAHQKGLLHRAFSVFIFNDKGELLIQRRALDKYHSPGLWTNSCCSHPKPKESLLDAAHRRLEEEMGMKCPNLQPVNSFIYKTDFDNGLIENEYDHIVLGTTNALPRINPDEVHEYAYLSIEEIKERIAKAPDTFTYWFKLAIRKIDFSDEFDRLSKVA